jgi:hypothetical protein
MKMHNIKEQTYFPSLCEIYIWIKMSVNVAFIDI